MLLGQYGSVTGFMEQCSDEVGTLPAYFTNDIT